MYRKLAIFNTNSINFRHVFDTCFDTCSIRFDIFSICFRWIVDTFRPAWILGAHSLISRRPSSCTCPDHGPQENRLCMSASSGMCCAEHLSCLAFLMETPHRRFRTACEDCKARSFPMDGQIPSRGKEMAVGCTMSTSLCGNGAGDFPGGLLLLKRRGSESASWPKPARKHGQLARETEITVMINKFRCYFHVIFVEIISKRMYFDHEAL